MACSNNSSNNLNNINGVNNMSGIKKDNIITNNKTKINQVSSNISKINISSIIKSSPIAKSSIKKISENTEDKIERFNSSNKVITVDLSSPKISEKNKNEFKQKHLNYIVKKTKVVNLDLAIVKGNNNNSPLTKEDIKLDRSKSDKLLFNNKSKIENLKSNQKYINVPTVKTKLYKSIEKNLSNYSTSDKNVTSKTKLLKNENSFNYYNSDDSLYYSENNGSINFNFNNLKLKLDDIKENIKKIEEKRIRSSVSPIRINYNKLREFSLVKNKSEEEDMGRGKKSNTIHSAYLDIDYEMNNGNNIRFLNLVRMKIKNENLQVTEFIN